MIAGCRLTPHAMTSRPIPLAGPALSILLGWLILLASAAHASAAGLPMADDLAAAGRAAAARGQPLVVMVSLPQCPYCHIVRRQYLQPLLERNEIEVREVDMMSSRMLRDFDGRQVSSQSWARARDVRLAPTVLFLDAAGQPLAGSLVGVSAEFYGGYLDQALAASRQRLARAHGTMPASD